jgi:hypothetical protein
MSGSRQPTVLGLLGPNLTVRTGKRISAERWFHRRDAKLSDRLLANAILWPVDWKGTLRRDLKQKST